MGMPKVGKHSMHGSPSQAHKYSPAPGSETGPGWSCSYPEGGRTGPLSNPDAFGDGSKTSTDSTKY